MTGYKVVGLRSNTSTGRLTSWCPNVFYREGYPVVDDEGGRHRVFHSGFSGEVEPLWGKRWTRDNDVIWRRI